MRTGGSASAERLGTAEEAVLCPCSEVLVVIVVSLASVNAVQRICGGKPRAGALSVGRIGVYCQRAGAQTLTCRSFFPLHATSRHTRDALIARIQVDGTWLLNVLCLTRNKCKVYSA